MERESERHAARDWARDEQERHDKRGVETRKRGERWGERDKWRSGSKRRT